jgi:hypothetical protein
MGKRGEEKTWDEKRKSEESRSGDSKQCGTTCKVPPVKYLCWEQSSIGMSYFGYGIMLRGSGKAFWLVILC